MPGHQYGHRHLTPYPIIRLISKTAWETIRTAHQFLMAIKKLDNLEGVVISRSTLAYKRQMGSAGDQHLEGLIQEAEETAKKPIAFSDLLPHERAILRALSRTWNQCCLTDAEGVRAYRRVLAYLEGSMKRVYEGQKPLF
jgi:hypothetical protein